LKNRHLDSATNESVRKLCRTLRGKNPLKQQAMSVLEEVGAPIPDIKPILRALLKPSPFQKNACAVASWLIVHAGWSDHQRGKLSEALTQAGRIAQ